MIRNKGLSSSAFPAFPLSHLGFTIFLLAMAPRVSANNPTPTPTPTPDYYSIIILDPPWAILDETVFSSEDGFISEPDRVFALSRNDFQGETASDPLLPLAMNYDSRRNDWSFVRYDSGVKRLVWQERHCQNGEIVHEDHLLQIRMEQGALATFDHGNTFIAEPEAKLRLPEEPSDAWQEELWVSRFAPVSSAMNYFEETINGWELYVVWDRSPSETSVPAQPGAELLNCANDETDPSLLVDLDPNLALMGSVRYYILRHNDGRQYTYSIGHATNAQGRLMYYDMDWTNNASASDPNHVDDYARVYWEGLHLDRVTARPDSDDEAARDSLVFQHDAEQLLSVELETGTGAHELVNYEYWNTGAGDQRLRRVIHGDGSSIGKIYHYGNIEIMPDNSTQISIPENFEARLCLISDSEAATGEETPVAAIEYDHDASQEYPRVLKLWNYVPVGDFWSLVFEYESNE